VADLSGYELTHKKILDSGKTNFLNDGYERANLRKICKDAGVREYHYVFCAVMACKVLRLLYGRIFSLGFQLRKCHGVFSAQLKHKRKVSGLPYDTPPLSCGYICQSTGKKLYCLVCGKGNADCYILKF